MTSETKIPATNFVRFRGDTIKIPFKLTLGSADLKISDCSSIIFTLKAKTKDTEFILQKTLEEGIETVDDPTGKGMVLIEPEDSPEQTSDKTYVYDLQVTQNNEVETVMWGNLVLTNDVTK